MSKNNLAAHVFLVLVKLIHFIHKRVGKPGGVAIVEDNREIGALVRIEGQKPFRQINEGAAKFRTGFRSCRQTRRY